MSSKTETKIEKKSAYFKLIRPQESFKIHSSKGKEPGSRILTIKHKKFLSQEKKSLETLHNFRSLDGRSNQMPILSNKAMNIQPRIKQAGLTSPTEDPLKNENTKIMYSSVGNFSKAMDQKRHSYISYPITYTSRDELLPTLIKKAPGDSPEERKTKGAFYIAPAFAHKHGLVLTQTEENLNDEFRNSKEIQPGKSRPVTNDVNPRSSFNHLHEEVRITGLTPVNQEKKPRIPNILFPASDSNRGFESRREDLKARKGGHRSVCKLMSHSLSLAPDQNVQIHSVIQNSESRSPDFKAVNIATVETGENFRAHRKKNLYPMSTVGLLLKQSSTNPLVDTKDFQVLIPKLAGGNISRSIALEDMTKMFKSQGSPVAAKNGSTIEFEQKEEPIGTNNSNAVYGRDKNYFFNQKYEQYYDYLFKINFSNMLYVIPDNKYSSVNTYKYCIFKGNNHRLIASMFKKRWWWSPMPTEPNKETKFQKINFLWTPWRHDDFLNIIDNYAPEADPDPDGDRTPIMPYSGGNIDKLIFNVKPLKKLLMSNDLQALADFQLFVEKNPYERQKFEDIFGAFVRKYQSHFPKKFVYHKIKDTKVKKICNHLENNHLLADKKGLFLQLTHFYRTQKRNPFENIPLTFHIAQAEKDPILFTFKQAYDLIKREANQSMWILKPGENSNRGTGIMVLNDYDEIIKVISQKDPEVPDRSFILQKYIENPLLFNKRKFDIRTYMLFTSINGIQKAYWYQEGYIRTSSYEFEVGDVQNPFIHLTNDAIQKNAENYGKFEAGNKISYTELQKYVEATYPEKTWNFMTDCYPKMKEMARDCIHAVYSKMDANHKNFCFELFGMDYMIDENMKPWLIEINTNPCIELSSPLLSKLIPTMLENMFKLVIDPLFPPPIDWPLSRRDMIPENSFELNKWEIIFDEREYLNEKSIG